jgi:uncharacterized small protein (DUF1192 family)
MRMDADTAEAVETLRADIHQVDASLQDEIRRVEAALRADIHQGDASLQDEIQRVEASLREEIRDVKRHADVVAESLRDDIRMIAEGVVSLSAKVESLRR